MENIKKMVIFEPAMCCSTGVCGPSVNSDLLQITTLASSLAKDGIIIERYNLTNNPQAFLDNKKINEIINKDGIDTLPVTMVDDEVVKTNQYPTTEEIKSLLGISANYVETAAQDNAGCCGGDSTCNTDCKPETKDKQESSCCSGGGCC